MQGAMSDLEPLADRYFATFEECAQAIRDLKNIVMAERADMLRKLKVRKLQPSQAPVLWVLADELPGIFARDDSKTLQDELRSVLWEGPKLGISVAMAAQQTKGKTVDTSLTSAALITIGLRCKTWYESRNVMGDLHKAGYDLTKLRKRGEAIIVNPDWDEPVRAMIHLPADGLEVRPSEPEDGPDDQVSDDVSDPVSEPSDTPCDVALEDRADADVSDVSGGPPPPRPDRLETIGDLLADAGERGLTGTELMTATGWKRPTILGDIKTWDGPGEVVQGVDRRYRLVVVASERTADA
jgi:hypothetical protein